MDSDQLSQDLTTMDDPIMISGGSQPSGTRQLLRYNERRMSRSCDYIKIQSSPTSILMMSPTSSGQEPTTSQGDYDDDERILLATVGRLAANKNGHHSKRCARQTPIVRLTHDKSPITINRNDFARNRCTRCRSWSPALLTKLEDCIYQIKSRIPGLSVKDDGRQIGQKSEDEGNRRRMPSTRFPDSVQSKDKDGFEGAEINNNNDNLSSNPNDQTFEGSENSMNVNRAPRATSSMVNRGIHPRLSRLHQQSSGTSDTLSTRTGGTIITNMSASFDSNTNIPNQVGQLYRDSGSQKQ